MTNDKLRMTMLFDFFGDLLTEKQREYYDLYHNEDLSLSEIAANAGITRQGVYDIILRAENILNETERKTGLIQRFNEMQLDIGRALELARCIGDKAQDNTVSDLATQLEDILNGLKG